MKRFLTTVVLLCSSPWIGSAAAAAERVRVELSDPSRPVDLQVEIEWGSIRVVGDATASEVTIEATPDRQDEVAGGLFSAGETENTVTVTQVPVKSGSFRSANLRITTPLETSVKLQMNRGGDIWVEAIQGLVEVTNLNGSVELSEIAGAAAVNASNGSIRAGFAAVDPDRDLFFGSLNGSIELCLPDGFSSRVNLTTAGDPIRSEFRIEREPSARKVAAGETLTLERTEVHGRIGANDSLTRVSTLNGEIFLGQCG